MLPLSTAASSISCSCAHPFSCPSSSDDEKCRRAGSQIKLVGNRWSRAPAGPPWSCGQEGPDRGQGGLHSRPPNSLRSYRPKALASLQLPVTSWTCALEERPRQIRSHSSPPQGWGLSSNHPQSQGLIPMRLRWSHRHWHSGRKQAALGSRTEAIPKGEPRLRERRKLA